MSVGQMGAQGSSGSGKRRQHFLLSAAARGLSLAQIARLSDDEAYKLLRGVRWTETEGQPTCPKCGCLAIYEHKSRRIFSCKECLAQFSVTSGTIFHSRKLGVRDILLAIAIFTNGAKGHAALHLGRDLNISYKTAFVLAHKIREALGAEIDERKAGGVVEIDGAYIGGHIRQANWAENRVDRRLAINQTGKRQVVIAMRERGGRTMTFIVRHEADAVDVLQDRILSGSTVHADEARSWDALNYAGVQMKRINHQECFSDGDACTNQVESFFSRMRRAEKGIHHHIAGSYAQDYANEMAWREDSRRISTANQFLIMAATAATHPPSMRWKGYWQRHLHIA